MADVTLTLDETDFHSKFTLFDEQNRTLIDFGLTQKKMQMIFLVFLGIVFIVLVAFNAIETKDIRDLRDILRD